MASFALRMVWKGEERKEGEIKVTILQVVLREGRKGWEDGGRKEGREGGKEEGREGGREEEVHTFGICG